jgi:hypothetical protein
VWNVYMPVANHGRRALEMAFPVGHTLEITCQAIDSELFTRNSAGLLPGAVVACARDVSAADRSPLKPSR